MLSASWVSLEKLCSQHNEFNREIFVQAAAVANQFHFIEVDRNGTYQFFTKQGIAVPRSQSFENLKELAQLMSVPCVVKASTKESLGPQTQIVNNTADYKTVVQTFLKRQYTKGIVQDRVDGIESTVTVIVGKHNWQLLGTAHDYKKLYIGNLGPNTGGMGSIAPAAAPLDQIDRIVTILKEQFDYKGFLSCQFKGHWLLECNTRICDPEMQSMAMSLTPHVYTQMEQMLHDKQIDQTVQIPVNAVTVCLMHVDWPNKQQPATIKLPKSKFFINYDPGILHNTCYLASITNFGNSSHQDLAQEIYAYLDAVNLSNYRYRTDIGVIYN